MSDVEGQPGPIGSGIGRVEFSSCKHYAANEPIVPLKSSLAVSFRFQIFNIRFLEESKTLFLISDFPELGN